MRTRTQKVKDHLHDFAPVYTIALATVTSVAVLMYTSKKFPGVVDPAHNMVIPDEWLKRMNETGEAMLFETNLGNFIMKTTTH